MFSLKREANECTIEHNPICCTAGDPGSRIERGVGSRDRAAPLPKNADVVNKAEILSELPRFFQQGAGDDCNARIWDNKIVFCRAVKLRM
jgi:hypothetical protein